MNSNARNNLLVLAQQMRCGRFYVLTTILNQQKVCYSLQKKVIFHTMISYFVALCWSERKKILSN